MRALTSFSKIFVVMIAVSCSLFAQEPAMDNSLDSLLSIPINTAAKYSQLIGQVPASVSIVTPDDIVRYGYRTIEDVMNSLRGFYTTYDRNYSYAGIRGFGRPTDYNNRILLLLNGFTTNENVYGSSAIGSDLVLDLRSIERIEIIRGPGSVLYGTGAMFSVINIITKRAASVDGIRITADAGSHDLRGLSFHAGKEIDDFEMFTTGSYNSLRGDDLYFPEYDSPSTNHGRAVGLDDDLSTGGMFELRYRRISFSGSIMSRKKGIPTGAFLTDFNSPETFTYDQKKQLAVYSDIEIGLSKSFSVQASLNRYDYFGTYPYGGKNTHDADVGIWYDMEPRFRWDVIEGDRVILGGEYRNHLRADYRYWDADTTFFNKDFPSQSISFYMDNELQLQANLLVRTGIRYDAYSDADNAFSPRLAVIYNPLFSTTVKLLYGEAFRIPTVYEKNYDDAYSGYKANLSLAPERIRTGELIVEHRISSDILGVVSIYNNTMMHLIDTQIDPMDGLKQFQNINSAHASGLEMELQARHPSGKAEYINYTFQWSRDDQGRLLTNAPEHMVKVGVSIPIIPSLFASLFGRYETKRKTVWSTYTDAYAVINANISYRPIENSLDISLLVNNVFDNRYATPAGFEHLQQSIGQNGRTLSIQVSYKP